MQFTFIPIRCNDSLTIARQGDTLIVNGQLVDFSKLAEGEEKEFDCQWIAGPVRRSKGMLSISLIIPHEADVSDEALAPRPIAVAQDGPVVLPL